MDEKNQPKRSTLRTKRYMESHGLAAKTYKIPKEIANKFKDACNKVEMPQSTVLVDIMTLFCQSVETEENDNESE